MTTAPPHRRPAVAGTPPAPGSVAAVAGAAGPGSPRSRNRHAAAFGAATLLAAVVLAWSPPCRAQAPGPGTMRPAIRPAEQGVRWADLKPSQQAALKPLEQEWPSIEARRKQKWLDLAARFSRLTPDERERVQTRMAEWARMSPAERGEARLRYQEAKQLPPADREARWKAYQALTPEEREQLAERARAEAGPRPRPRPGDGAVRAEGAGTGEYPAPPRAISPAVVQAGPGATTTLITRRPAPPDHLQTGMPKIAATPGFVDKSTLLPRRGPQGAAIRAASAPAAAPEGAVPRR